MGARRLSTALVAAIKSAAVGEVRKLVLIGGFQYGSQNEVIAGISSLGPRVSPLYSLFDSALDWRGLAGQPAQLTKVGAVTKTYERGDEFSFSFSPPTDPESVQGLLGQADVQYALVQPTVPTTTAHGLLVDGLSITTPAATFGMTQQVTPAGSRANQQWTFSCYVASPTPAGGGAATVRMLVGLSDASQQTNTAVSYTGAGKWQRINVTKLFNGAPSTNTLRVIVAPLSGTNGYLLVAAAQLELNTVPTAYERTSEIAAGARNVLLGSHWPTRSPWTQLVSTQTITITPDAGRGPEVRAIVPTPGTVEFGLAQTREAMPDGFVQLLPVDTYGQTADKFSSTATGKCGIYVALTRGVTGKTYVVSAWVRHTGANIPANVGLWLSPWDNTNAHLVDSIQEFVPSHEWRRVWWSFYVDAALYPTATQIEAVFFSDDPASGKDTEWFGYQLEEFAGDAALVPSAYQPTTSAGVAPNLLQRSAEADNGYWNKASVTVTANSGYGPVESYNVLHPDYGIFATQLRINQWKQLPSQDWENVPFGIPKEYFSGEAFSIGAYGAELFGVNGDFTTWAAGVPNGFTIVGTASDISQATALPFYWSDDEEAGTPSGVAQFVPAGNATPRTYLNVASFALSVGWHTFRLRVAHQQSNVNTVVLALQRSTDSKWMDADCVRFRQASPVWIPGRAHDIGLNSPDFGVSIWHVFIPTATNYAIRIGATSSAGATLYYDQLRIWFDGGALYASPADRTETKGTNAFQLQGLNVLFRGIIDDSVGGDETTVECRALDYIHGTDQQLPILTAKTQCQLKFRGLECGYVSTTTFTAASGGGTSHQVASTANLVAGRYIIGSDGASWTKIVTITDGTHFTTDTGQSYLNGGLLKYADCRKNYGDCSRRARTFRYLGCRATQALQAAIGTPFMRVAGPPSSKYGPNIDEVPPHVRNAGALLAALTINGQQTLNDKKIFDAIALPILYGRKSVKLIPIETHATKLTSDNSEWLTTFYVMGLGPIHDVRMFFTPDGPMIGNYASGVMIYWHPGNQGTDDWWTLTNHNAATGTSKIPNQSRDFRTNTDTTYNRMGYAISMIRKGNPLVDLHDPTKIIELWADLQTREVQAYDQNGVAVGSPAWSRNPAWLLLDALLNGLFGPALPRGAIDWYAFYRASVTCAATITSSEAVSTITITTGNNVVIQLDSVNGFAPEMPCTVNGVAHTVKFVDPINQRLFMYAAVTAPTVGQIVQGTPARYTCDIAISQVTTLADLVDKICASCRGFIAFDGGKLGLYVENGKNDTSAATWAIATPTPSDFLGVIAESVKYDQRRGSQNDYNVLEATYESGQLLNGSARIARFTDADRGGLDFPRVLSLHAEGCDTADQALRSLLPKYAKACAVYTGVVGDDARAYSAKTGPSMMRALPGDFVTQTRTGRPTIGKTRIQSITINPDYTIDIKTRPEAGQLRAEGFVPTFDPFTDTPFFVSEAASALGTGAVALTVAQSAAAQLKATIVLSGYATGPGTSPGQHVQKFTGIELHASTSAGFTPTSGKFGLGGTLIGTIDPTAREFIWDVPSGLLETQIYLKVAALQGSIGFDPVYSSEVGTIIYKTTKPTSDPTQQQGSYTENMVHGADFQNAGDWTSDSTSPWTGNYQQPTALTTPKRPDGDTAFTDETGAAATVAKITDVNDATYLKGISTSNAGVDTAIADLAFFSFGAGTGKTGRPYVRLLKATGNGSIVAWYTLDRTAGTITWVQWLQAAPTLATDYFGPELTGIDYSKFLIDVECYADYAAGVRSVTGRLLKGAFEEKGNPSVAGSVTGNVATLYGDGTNYGNLRRAFPGKAPTGTQVAFNAGTLNHMRIQVKKHVSTDTLDGNPLEVRIYDADKPSSTWTLGSIPSASITSSFVDWALKFSPGSQVVGTNLQIEIRTKNTKAIDVDKILVARGDTLFAWTPGPEDKSTGYFGDFANGDAVAFSLGSWTAGQTKQSVVS